MLLTIVPTRYGEGVGNALDSIQKLLMRYFIGITFEVLIVMGLNILGLTIVGLPFNNAVLIGLITGITNVIPYMASYDWGGFRIVCRDRRRMWMSISTRWYFPC